MSVYLAAAIAAAALLVGSAVIALAIVRQTARRRDSTVPGRYETDAARTVPEAATARPSAAAEDRDLLLFINHPLFAPLLLNCFLPQCSERNVD